MRNRLATLRTAALLAAGFVVLRVVYRMVFGGGSGDGVLLLDLPRIPLPGPFAGIALLGPVTTGGLASAALGALPFAAVILAIGLLGVVVDLRSLLARGAVRGPVRAIARALVIAWSTFPELGRAVARVRRARELRAERSLAALLVPVLEQTVERAIALGASMEVRGFAAARLLDPRAGAPPAVLAGAGLGIDGRRILEGVDLRLAPGTLVLVSGPTGSGKSTLLDALSGLFQHLALGDQEGRIEVGGIDRSQAPPRETAGLVGAVAQSARLSFVASTVAEELRFALAIRGIPPAGVRARAAEVAAALGIEHLLERETRALSAGEACLVALGAALVARPRLLVVDEPLADLDDDARERVVEVLERLVHRDGICVVVAEHALEPWAGRADERFELAGGRLRAAGPERAAASPAAPEGRAGAVIAEVRGLTVRHGDRLAVDDARLELAAGEVVALRGPNGAGKSSLLEAIGLAVVPGTVFVDGADIARLGRTRRRRAVALVPEESDDLLFATTVAGECRRADRRAPGPGAAGLFLRLLGVDARTGAGILDRHPRDLSAGERLCLVIAIQLSARPRVLLVDEPTRGLDAAARALVGAALARAAAEGAAVMVATHDRGFAARHASRTVAMSAGRLAPQTASAPGIAAAGGAP